MTEILDRPVDCAANWKGPEIARSTDWIPDRVNALISRVAYVAWRSGQLNTRFHRRKTAWPRYPQIYTFDGGWPIIAPPDFYTQHVNVIDANIKIFRFIPFDGITVTTN